MKRIAFMGPSGTGKTTVAEALSKKLDLPINPVGSRSVAKDMGFDSPYDVDKAGKRGEFQVNLLNAKYAWEDERRYMGFITDRTYLDNLAYTIMHGASTLTESFINTAKRYTDIYTHIVFFDMDTFINIGDDKTRVKELEYHKTYEWILDMIGRDWEEIAYGTVTINTVESVGVEDRVKEIMEFLGE